ncbi:hypothetical protein WJX84_011708 [Apatococcus fuscideae]|uniref:Sugar phosphate transporter domain-containing protein n=2 Tax=Apatococcus fuscideae TaxID=2026836 RepID=A0AAW1TBL3_9CHLO
MQPLINGQQSPRPARDTLFGWRPLWWQNKLLRAAAKNVGLILTWYFFSTCLSIWLTQLLGKRHGIFGKGPFPAPLLMTSLQFAAQNLMARLVMRCGLIRKVQDKEALSWRQYAKEVVPNGVSTGLDIAISNYSLSLITLSFYTMCKSTTPVFLLICAFIWGIERPSWNLAVVVAIICTGLIMLVAGETQFNLIGFMLVMSASMLSGLRWTITQVLLQGTDAHGKSGGPLEVLLQLTPVMALTAGACSLATEQLWYTLPRSPYFASPSHLLVTGLVILFGGAIAFLMVWTEFTVIAETSALTFMVAGTFKEIVTVMAAVLFLGEDFTLINAMGLMVLVSGVIFFNYFRYQKSLQTDLGMKKSHSLDIVEEGRQDRGHHVPPPGSPSPAKATGLTNVILRGHPEG